MADIELPQLGESVTEGTITRWFKEVGDQVAEDEPLFEVSTDKVDSEVPSPSSGYLAEILVEEGDTVDVGTRIAVLSDAPPGEGGGGDGAAAPADEPAAEAPAEPAAEAPAEEPAEAPAAVDASAPDGGPTDPAGAEEPAAEEAVEERQPTAEPAPAEASPPAAEAPAPAAEQLAASPSAADGPVLSPVVRR
ncbi:MAG TPA: lipoyl domain-containing protein, partial [Aquihabitans sp.]|nr:lipoyl domain-containing protein [Aquihabitans sp.]